MSTLNNVKIENLTSWLRSLRLNSGEVLHMPPRSISQSIIGVEVQDNAEVNKLLERGVITVHAIATEPQREMNEAPQVMKTNIALPQPSKIENNLE